VPGVGLRAGGAAIFSGKGGEGKSLLSLGAFLAWAEGLAPFGCPALKPERPLRILAFYLEDDPVAVQDRLRHLLGGRWRAAPENLMLFGRQEEVRLAGSGGHPDESALRRLQATLEAHGPVDVCALDPLAYVHDADENQAGEMLRWLRPLRECVRATGAATWLTHHTGWEGDRGRGTSGLQAWADLELNIKRVGARRGREVTRLSLVKCNFAPRWPAPVDLAFDARTLGFRLADEAGTLCPSDDLAAWVRRDLAGGRQGKLTDFYAAVAEHFGCGRRTAETAVKRAFESGLLAHEGRGPSARVWVP
jgi:hypothetical protein